MGGVGSAIVKIVAQYGKGANGKIKDFVSEMKKGIIDRQKPE
jgi:tryptophan synthase alpha subunit